MGPDPQYVGKLHSNSDKGDGSVKYILTGEGAGTIFIIDDTTGDIHSTKSLDREQKTHYVLHAQAIDRRTNKPLEPESEFIIKVQDINDNAPKFTDGPYIVTVPEMSDMGTSVLQVTATDADDPTYGNSARVVYSILQGQPYFSVDPKTGVIRTALHNMDREAREHYSVVIQAKDMAGQVGGLSGSTTVNITLTDVNDNPPRFPQNATMLKIIVGDVDEPPLFSMPSYLMEVYENAKIGTVVGTVLAQDPDSTNSLVRYFINYNVEDDRFFNIDANTGTIRTTKVLDREETPWYNITVTASEIDNPDLLSHVAVGIRVLDVNDNPPELAREYDIIVCENSKPGQVIHTISATDKDDFANGPRFNFFLDERLPVNPNFTLKDNEAIVVLFITLRRSKKEPLIISEEDVRENVVTYDDEGGGEEDTEAFDITALRNPSAAEELKYRRDIRPEVKLTPRHQTSSTLESIDVQEFIKQRVAEADLDPSVPPYDSLQTYAYEGQRSEAGSISSLDSATTQSDQDYHYLGDWGPEFKKLAELYGEIESERTT
ncbi:CDH18 isoform 5 [Pan troglodytes]|uniref:CDH18 isoform 5 n=1 Tax=Pan troglodytes TaxID=9598 RepID=A0A2J8KJX6_PANTR|nr:CDH18 isoform 5 [Pan troglodytes]